LGVSPAHVTDLEKGYRVPSEDLLLRIAKHYQLDEAVLRAGWARPDAVVHEVASQDSVTAAKVPEFLRTARTLSPEQWDQLIAQAKTLTGDSAKGGASRTAANKVDASQPSKPTNPRGGAKGGGA
jgi:transcriptional regulator with XRE-family HTH domain